VKPALLLLLLLPLLCCCQLLSWCWCTNSRDCNNAKRAAAPNITHKARISHIALGDFQQLLLADLLQETHTEQQSSCHCCGLYFPASFGLLQTARRKMSCHLGQEAGFKLSSCSCCTASTSAG
jgi:hypothetical protein